MPLYLDAILLGFLSSIHCAGMCGGLTMSLSLLYQRSLNAGGNTRGKLHFFGFLLLSQLGRITTYMLLGLALTLVSGVFFAEHYENLSPYLRSIAGITLILLGIYLGGWWQGTAFISKLTIKVFRKFNPFNLLMDHLHKPGAPFALGVIWGFLPCGLVYSILLLALTQPQTHPALFMGAFGIGTLPMLLSASMSAPCLIKYAAKQRLKICLALSMIGFGIWTCAAPWLAIKLHQEHSHTIISAP